MPYLNDTICAISTPAGSGGIAVIRLSGVNAFDIIEKVFFKSKDREKGLRIADVNSHTIHFGYLFNNEKLVDEVLVSVFKEPNSFTGENVIEISTHGGVFVTQKTLETLTAKGARLAEPGEFSKRAFLNGRIDLSQAEAIADLIKAKTEEAHKSSISQLEGSLSAYVKEIREELISVTALVELELDFAEEDIEFAHKSEIRKRLLKISADLSDIIHSYISGKVIREGINVVIAGKPNSGKSSLFNALLKTERAIVSSISGTTRDYLEEHLIINGVLFNLTDTAGLRSTEDIIEHEGIKRSYGKINEADLVLYLIDSSETESDIAHSVGFFHENIESENKILVFTKTDISDGYRSAEGIHVSVSDGKSLSALKDEMVLKVRQMQSTTGAAKVIITNIRHKACLENTVIALGNVIASLDKNMSGEFLSVDLRNALNHLGEITGSVTNDDILAYVFSKFCIGK